mmetsp:Transcript_6095/g.13278  ORF Transcript_6095/g.13278 Transcript_6095/m.13278 type:complete len:209 (-) Transcript_6095:983-1609(-)
MGRLRRSAPLCSLRPVAHAVVADGRHLLQQPLATLTVCLQPRLPGGKVVAVLCRTESRLQVDKAHESDRLAQRIRRWRAGGNGHTEGGGVGTLDAPHRPPARVNLHAAVSSEFGSFAALGARGGCACGPPRCHGRGAGCHDSAGIVGRRAELEAEHPAGGEAVGIEWRGEFRRDGCLRSARSDPVQLGAATGAFEGVAVAKRKLNVER